MTAKFFLGCIEYSLNVVKWEQSCCKMLQDIVPVTVLQLQKSLKIGGLYIREEGGDYNEFRL